MITKMKTKVALIISALALLFVLVAAFVWMSSYNGGYDRYWSECMRDKSGGTYHFSSTVDYDRGAHECDTLGAIR